MAMQGGLEATHVIAVAGLQAIMPEIVLIALATHCPTSASEVVQCAHSALHGADSSVAEDETFADLQQAVPLQLCQQAGHVSHMPIETIDNPHDIQQSFRPEVL